MATTSRTFTENETTNRDAWISNRVANDCDGCESVYYPGDDTEAWRPAERCPVHGIDADAWWADLNVELVPLARDVGMMSRPTGPRLPFFSDCVAWPRDRLEALRYLVDEGELISRRTFLRRVDRSQIPAGWEPCPPGTPYGDAFYVLPRQPVYWYVHSAIEFVFAKPAAIEVVQALAELGVRP